MDEKNRNASRVKERQPMVPPILVEFSNVYRRIQKFWKEFCEICARARDKLCSERAGQPGNVWKGCDHADEAGDEDKRDKNNKEELQRCRGWKDAHTV
jgi:hypothetical protein